MSYLHHQSYLHKWLKMRLTRKHSRRLGPGKAGLPGHTHQASAYPDVGTTPRASRPGRGRLSSLPSGHRKHSEVKEKTEDPSHSLKHLLFSDLRRK